MKKIVNQMCDKDIKINHFTLLTRVPKIIISKDQKYILFSNSKHNKCRSKYIHISSGFHKHMREKKIILIILPIWCDFPMKMIYVT